MKQLFSIVLALGRFRRKESLYMLKQKTVSIILVILMLLSLLGGCRSSEVSQSIPASTSSIPTTAAPTTAAPTTAAPTTTTQPTRHDPYTVPSGITEKHIKTFYRRSHFKQTKDTQLYYFGAFDDAYAVLIRDKTRSFEPSWETVNGLTFYYPDGYPIYWENDQAFDIVGGHLWEMFNRGLITEAQLQEIYDNYYSTYPELLYLANGQLEFGEEEMEAICQALFALTGEEIDWDDVNTKPYVYNPRLVYYCSIMGAHVFRWIPYYHTGLLEYQRFYVGPYSFTHEEFFQLYVYVGEELWTLEEAYDRGFFADEHIETIQLFHGTSSQW